MTFSPRIGLLTPAWPGQNTPNGITTSVYFLAMGLREIGVKPVILASRIDGPCPPDIPVIPIPDLDWRLQDRLRARFGDASLQGHMKIARNITAAMRAACETHGLDVLIMEETNGWAALLQKPVPVPVILTLHGPWALLRAHATQGNANEDTKREERERRGFMAAAGIIAPSRNVLAAAEKAATLFRTPKIVVPNSFRTKRPEALSAYSPRRDILFVGRFDFLKGADTVLAAFERLLETHPKARLTFVGPDRGLRLEDGSVIDMNEMQTRLPAQVRARLTYKGAISKEDIARLRTEHAIALIASRFETLGYTLLEAMAAGQAIVCTQVGGPAEILAHEDTALLVPPADPEAMAGALTRLLDDADLVAHLGDSARAKVERDFNPATVAEETVRFVETTLAAQENR